MEFLAIYQSERPNVGFGKGKSAEMGAVAGAEKVRRTSRLWKGHGDVFEVSEMALREGVLVEVLGRYEGVEGTFIAFSFSAVDSNHSGWILGR